MAAAARRYAQAYFELAREADQLGKWGKELKRAQQTLADPRLGVAMANPRVRIPDRVDLAMQLLDGVSAAARNLVRLLISRGRLGILGDVVDEYDAMLEAAEGVLRATVTSAVALDPAAEKRLAAALTERFRQPVRVENRHDPAIVGGLVVRVGDRVIDNSVRTHLQQLQAALA